MTARTSVRTRTTRAQRREPQPPSRPTADMKNLRVHIEYKDINDIVPYEYNARDNAKAISAVAKSIEQFGFLIPVVIDENDILVAGHTRVEAAKTLGMAEVPSIQVTHLTQEQVMAFRLIDNKVAEIADWDYDLLGAELAKLDGLGFEFTDFGWTQEEMDCLRSVVAEDCLSTTNLVPQETEERARAAERRAPTQARIVVGEIVFFVPAIAYRNWADGIRRLHDFNEEAIAEDLKQRLGIIE